MKMLNNMGPNTGLWDALLVTVSQLDVEVLVTTLQIW